MFRFMNSPKEEESFDFEGAQREYIADIRNRYNERRKTEVPTAAITLQAEGEAPFGDPTYLFWSEVDSYFFFPSYMTVTTREQAERADKMQILRLDKSACTLRQEENAEPPTPTGTIGLTQIYEKLPILLTMNYMIQSGAGTCRFTAPNTLEDVRKLNLHIPGLNLPNFYNIINLPKRIYSVKCSDSSDLFSSPRHFTVWREEERLNFLFDMRGSAHTAPSLEVASIPLDIIEYYGVEGNVNYEDRISGGGGGELNVKGAVIGGLLFGAAGAILGGKREIRDVHTEHIEHDDRLTLLSVVAGGQRHLVRFELEAMDAFHALIPEKNYETLSLYAKSEPAPEPEAKPAQPTIPQQIEHLARLKEQGILTEEEFTDAKKALLAELMGKS